MKARGLVLEGKNYRAPAGAAAPALSLPDLSRYGNNGTFVNNPTWVQLPSGLWVLNLVAASSQYINCGTDISLYPAAFTYEAWVNPSSLTSHRGVISVGFNEAAVQGAFIIVDPSGGFSLVVRDGIDGQQASSGAGTVPINTWTYVVGTFDGTNILVYVNGTWAGTAVQQPVVYDTSFICMIGSYKTTVLYFNGNIALPRIYDYALTPDQINSHFAAERTLFGV